MKTITKKDLIKEIHKKEEISPLIVRRVLESFFKSTIKHIHDGKRIEIRNFGIFAPVLRKSKIGRNPMKANHPIIIPARYMIKFTPGQKVKKLFNEKKVEGKKSERSKRN